MEQKVYELTIPQKSIWLTEQYFQNTTINNICGSLIIEENVNLNILNKAINIFVENNDSFCLRFKKSGSDLLQYFVKNENIDFEILNFSCENQIEKVAKVMVNTKFNLFDSRVFDFKLFKLPSGFGGFIVNVHHIISDAATFSMIGTEIVEIYSCLLNNKTIPVKTYSYLDYINSEKEYLKSSRFKKDKIYWNETLSSSLDVATFPSNKVSKNSNDFRANRKEFILDKKIISKIKDFCAKNNLSMFNFLTGIYSIYFGRINNMDNFLLGTPVLNRTNYAQKHTCGMFISTSLLQMDLQENLPFAKFLQNIAQNSLGMLKHQKYNYQYILDDLKKKDSSLGRLYDIILSYQITKATSQNLGVSYHTKWYGTDYIANTLDIHFHDNDDSGKLLIEYDYQISKIKSSDILNLHKRILYLINQVLNDENILIDNLEIVTPDEKDIILNNFNNNFMDFYPKKDIITVFKEAVTKNPNKIALVFQDELISYKDLDEMSDYLAYYMNTIGVKNGENVAIFLDKSVGMVVSILAILKIHSAYLPIDISYPNERIEYILKDANVSTIITNSNLNTKNYENINYICIDKLDLYEKCKFDYLPSNVCDIAYIMYTSGSTGKPKGVVIEQKSILRLIKNPNYINFGDDEHILQTGSIVFDACTFEIWGALLNNFSLYILPKEDLLDATFLSTYLVDNEITILWLTAALFNQLCDINASMFKSVKYLLTGGDVLSVKHINKVMKFNPNLKVINGYGPTENTTFTCCFNIDKHYTSRIPIGFPISGTTCYVVSKSGMLQPIGVPGELWTGGLGVAKGYLNNPELTSKKFVPNPYNSSDIVYKTGDLVKWLPDGSIDFIGRNDNQVKIRGFRVELNEITNTILNYSKVKNCTTVIQNINGTKFICSYLIAKESFYIEELKVFLAKTLPNYMIPSYFVFMDFLPITVNGKIDKSKLPLPEVITNNQSSLKAFSPIEKEIFSAIKSLSSNKNLSIDDNFFYDIGLDSLDAMKLCAKLYKYNINIQDISSFPTVKLLAKKIETNYNVSIFDNNLPNINIYNKVTNFDLSNILITGALGYLAMHLLKELLLNPSVKNVFCMVRNKSNANYKKRFEKMLYFYFGNTLDELVSQKVKVVCGDFTDEKFDMADSDFTYLTKNVTTAIHCGATVKHYGNFEKFNRTNVVGTKNIINFCNISGAKMAHISTISVGGYCPKNLDLCLTENDFNIKQIFNNHVYMITKYLAEYEILKALNSKNIEGKIFRLGNIMPRFSDNVFQHNFKDNAIVTKLQAIMQLKCMPESYSNLMLDFSPVDLCAKSIVKLLELKDTQTVYHIYNNNVISLKNFLNLSKINCKIIPDSEMINIIQNSSNPLSIHILDDLGKNKLPLTKTDNKLTIDVLNSCGFSWNKTDENYVNRFMTLFN